MRISALTLARQGPDAEADWFVAALRAGLNEHAGADAICCFNDVTALATMSHLQAQGLRVPTDVAVVGFGDSEMAPYTTPPLASVSRCFERVAEQAAHLGLTRLRGQADAPRIVRVPARFVCRESAGRLEQTPAVSPTVHHPVPGIPSLES